MDPLTSSYIAELLASLSHSFIIAGGAILRDAVTGSPKEKAVNRCLRSGLTALLANADYNSETEQYHLLRDIFKDFFSREETAQELSLLLQGRRPALEKLRDLFDKAGYDAETLPGIDFNRAMLSFEAAFNSIAAQESELQGIIVAGGTYEQNKIQRELLDYVKQSYLETLYLDTLIGECEYVQLSLIDKSLIDKSESDGSGLTREVKISDVFTPLKLLFENHAVAQEIGDKVDPENTKDYSIAEFFRLQAVEAAAYAPRLRLVVLGQPGAGKSALVNYLTVQLARKRLNGFFDAEEKMPGWKLDQNPLPVRIILREFAAGLSATGERSGRRAADLVWDYLKNQWEDYYPLLKRELIENGGFIFFDGLDEVSTADEKSKRADIVDIITQFSEPLHKCSILVTCREYDYQEKSKDENTPVRQPDDQKSIARLDEQKFPVAQLAPLDEEDIENFISIWYGHIGPQRNWSEKERNQKATELSDAIRKLPHLKELAQYPLLLTLIAIVHIHDGFLPESRADLYDRAIMLRLIHWENPKLYGIIPKNDHLEKFNIPPVALRNILAEVAFVAHKRQEKPETRSENVANISGGELRTLLEANLVHSDKKQIPHIAKITIDYLADRAGLLQIRGKKGKYENIYAFPHRTFQEYLAAVHILKQPDFVKELQDRVFDNMSWWREVFLLAAGISGKEASSNLLTLVNALLPKATRRKINRQNINRALLASQVLLENKFDEVIQKEKYSWPYTEAQKNVRTWLKYALTADKKLEPPERITSGINLARLGDPRKEIVSLDEMSFCYVLSGAYYRGGHDHERLNLLHESIDETYWISRYQVTQAQFKLFVDDGGYGKPAFWIKKSGWEDGKYDRRDAPKKIGHPFDLPNHPVVGVSWVEAVAFTRWLSEKWKDNILLPGFVVRLPTEREWEKAARGGLKTPKKPLIVSANRIKQVNPDSSISPQKNPFSHRIYPWGDSGADPNRMNFIKSNITGTSPVGCFPGGASPCGCEDMCGNVSEWCFDKWEGTYMEDFRVIRGGSFGDLDDSCQLTYRTKKKSNVTINSLGFRLVITTKGLDR